MATLAASVVFPTPPLPEIKAMTCMDAGFIKKDSGANALC
jgi:hypothetical protein